MNKITIFIINILITINAASLQSLYEDYIKCPTQQCEIYDTCTSCLLNSCCTYNVDLGQCQLKESISQSEQFYSPPNYSLLNQTESPPEIDSLVTYPLVSINEPIPLFKATNFKHQKFETCGIPSYCPQNTFLTGTEAQLKFEPGQHQVKKGEVCSWYFSGDMGPTFIFELVIKNFIAANNTLTNNSIPFELGICYQVGTFKEIPCIYATLMKNVNNDIGATIKIPVDNFRLTVQFQVDAIMNLDQFEINLISYKKLSKEHAEKLFETLLIMLSLFFGIVLMLTLIKTFLFRILGRRFRFFQWIDPEPLILNRRRRVRVFDSGIEMDNLKKKHIIKEIVYKPGAIRFEQETCPYCFEYLNTLQIIELYCGHIFHEQCFKNHLDVLKQIGTCSICKVELTESAMLSRQNESTNISQITQELSVITQE